MKFFGDMIILFVKFILDLIKIGWYIDDMLIYFGLNTNFNNII